MNLKDLAELLATIDKIQIENTPTLTDFQKEICKHCIDTLKKKVQ